jgi:hypothetical protein
LGFNKESTAAEADSNIFSRVLLGGRRVTGLKLRAGDCSVELIVSDFVVLVFDFEFGLSGDLLFIL